MELPVTIVCVDDEDIVLVSLEAQLGHILGQGCTIETAESAEEALELLEELEEEGCLVPLVISDHIMPGMKGDELLCAIHQRSPKTLKILLTGQADVHAVGNAVNKANLYRYITKPWDKTDLGLTVKEALRSFIQNQELEAQNTLLLQRNQELEALNKASARFVPRQLLDLLDKESITDVQRGDQIKQEMAILFSDIRDFTSLSEQMTPEENFTFINSYLGKMEPHIAQFGGFIDKYIGDAIMALFPNTDSAARAGLAMLNTLKEMNQGLERPIHIGIGVHVGNLMLGVVGGASRIDGTVIGDVVQLASAVEGLTKRYSVDLLLSEAAVAGLKDPDAFALRKVGRAPVKGKARTVRVYELFDADPLASKTLKQDTQDDFEAAVALYQQDELMQARSMFQGVLKRNPGDNAARLYVERIDQALIGDKRALSMTHFPARRADD